MANPPDEEESERLVFHIKVCSARKLGGPINSYVAVEFGSLSRQTSLKKNTEKPIWNESFAFPVPEGADRAKCTINLRLIQKDILGKSYDKGYAEMKLPDRLNELQDTWISLTTTSQLQPDIHLCMQVELLGDRSLDSVIGRQSVRGSLMRFGGSSRRVLGVLSNNDTELKSAADPVPKSDFAVKASVVTLNEICQSLDRLRGVIYLSGDINSREGEDHVVQLQKAKVELDDLEKQVEAVEGLSEEWKEKLVSLIDDYSRDCWKMLSDKSWERITKKRQSTRAPPPLPSKEAMEQIRRSRPLITHSSSVEANFAANSQNARRDTANHAVPQSPTGRIKPHMVTIKPHFVSSLDAFDSMIECGFAIEVISSKKSKGKSGSPGDVATFKMTSYIYDAVICKIISYDGPCEIIYTIGTEHPDIPQGLDKSLKSITDDINHCIVTVAPDWGFGDDGHEKGVPPNSTLVFEIEEIVFRQTGATNDEVEFQDSTSEKHSLAKLYGTFPARDPYVVINRDDLKPNLDYRQASVISDDDSNEGFEDYSAL